MSSYDIILSRRTIRQFKPIPVPLLLLEKLVNAARLAPSAGNLQPLEFVIVSDGEMRKRVFSCLRWAGYIAPDGNPQPGNEPMAYIVTLINMAVKEKGFEYDAGAAMENMILAAWEEGLGSCWIISVQRENMAKILSVPEGHKIDCVLALGYPAEKPVIEELKDSVKYWKDKAGVLHVPKRSLKDIIHLNKF